MQNGLFSGNTPMPMQYQSFATSPMNAVTQPLQIQQPVPQPGYTHVQNTVIPNTGNTPGLAVKNRDPDQPFTQDPPPVVQNSPGTMKDVTKLQDGEHTVISNTQTGDTIQKDKYTLERKTVFTGCYPLVIFAILALVMLIITLFLPGSFMDRILNLAGGIAWALIWGFFIWLACRSGVMWLAWFLTIGMLIFWGIWLVLIFMEIWVWSGTGT